MSLVSEAVTVLGMRRWAIRLLMVLIIVPSVVGFTIHYGSIWGRQEVINTWDSPIIVENVEQDTSEIVFTVHNRVLYSTVGKISYQMKTGDTITYNSPETTFGPLSPNEVAKIRLPYPPAGIFTPATEIVPLVYEVIQHLESPSTILIPQNLVIDTASNALPPPFIGQFKEVTVTSNRLLLSFELQASTATSDTLRVAFEVVSVKKDTFPNVPNKLVKRSSFSIVKLDTQTPSVQVNMELSIEACAGTLCQLNAIVQRRVADNNFEQLGQITYSQLIQTTTQ